MIPGNMANIYWLRLTKFIISKTTRIQFKAVKTYVTACLFGSVDRMRNKH